MTKAAALYQFFSGFDMPAYASTAVPEDAVLPYLTYDLITSAWEGGEVGLTVNLWFLHHQRGRTEREGTRAV